MASAEYNFTIEQGTSVSIPFIYTDSNNVPVNLTGYKVRMQARMPSVSPNPLIDASDTNGKFEIHPAEGKVVLELGATETSTYTWRRAKYDIEIESPSGFVTRLLHGTISISPEVTK